MAIHLTECAALSELPASKKLVLMACADSADKDTRIALPGFDNIVRWSGLKRSRAMEVIAELVAEGYLVRRSSGRAGRRAEFYVFPAGCCAMHGPLPLLRSGSAQPDPAAAAPESPSGTPSASATPDPVGSAGPDAQPEVQGPEVGPVWTGPLPSSEVLPPQPPTLSGGRTPRSTTRRTRPSRANGTNPRALQAAEDRAASERRQAAAASERQAKVQAIAACPRCSKAGYLPNGKVCDHDPDTPQRAARGLALVREQLASRGTR